MGGNRVQLTLDDYLFPSVEIDGRIYRASNFRLTADKVKVANVEYFHPDRGWREVRRWQRILEVADQLWPSF